MPRRPKSPDSRAFELGENEQVSDGVRRIAQGQLDIASELDVDDERSVHEARKAFKRLRALLRLTRDQLGNDIRRRENAAFRDAGRHLSGARDARVLVETLDALAPEGFAGLRTALAQDTAEQPDDAAVKQAVEDARGRVEIWPLDDAGPKALGPGMKRIRKRGRRAYKAAKGDPSTEHMHELRKRTKDLWHAGQILHKRKLARDAHKLSDVLGEDHDLATLLDAAGRHEATMSPDERAHLEQLVNRRRAKLQRKALRRAKDLC